MFIYFRRMLQMFYLDVVKVYLVFECCSENHLPQHLLAAAGPLCMHVRAEGVSGRRARLIRNPEKQKSK